MPDDPDPDQDPDTENQLSDEAIESITSYSFPEKLAEATDIQNFWPKFKHDKSIEATCAVYVTAGTVVWLTADDVEAALAQAHPHSDTRLDYPRGTVSPRMSELEGLDILEIRDDSYPIEYGLTQTGYDILTGEMDPYDHDPFSQRREQVVADADTDAGGEPSASTDTDETDGASADGGVETSTYSWSAQPTAAPLDTITADTLDAIAGDIEALVGEDDAVFEAYALGIRRTLGELGASSQTDTVNSPADNEQDDA